MMCRTFTYPAEFVICQRSQVSAIFCDTCSRRLHPGYLTAILIAEWRKSRILLIYGRIAAVADVSLRLKSKRAVPYAEVDCQDNAIRK
jgi:hypothetical protein